MTASYGDVTAEYLAVRRGAGVLPAHEIVWVRGPDAVPFLDGLVSQRVDVLPIGSIAPSLLLSPQGKLRAPHWLLKGGQEVGLLADIGSGAIVIEDLNRFKIRVDVAISDEPEAALDVWGPEGASVLETLGLDPDDGWSSTSGRLAAVVPFRRSGAVRFVIAGVDIEEVIAAGAMRVGRLAADAARIEQGEVVNGVDVDEKTIPAEADLVGGAVDFDKGCYLGQELVARIDSRGHVNRHLCGIQITTNVVPPVGAEVAVDGKTVGALTSVAESLDLRAPVGLSLLRREVDIGDVVTVSWDGGQAPAVVRDLPMVDDKST